MMKWTSLVRTLATTLLVSFLVVSLVGCEQQAGKTTEAPKASEKPADKAKAPAKAEPAKAEPAKPATAVPAAPAAKSAQPAPATPAQPAPAPKPSAQATPAPTTPKTPPAVQKTTDAPAKTPAAPDTTAQNADKRAQIEDIIYADMRVKMEQMIVQRAQLMKAGKDSSDPEVAKLEASILRAKKFLTDAGEMVGPIDPPIKEPAQLKK